jgi:DNA polymerase-3 subunit alpha
MNISLLPPDINLSYSDFSVDGANIRYGLSAIKGLGRPVIDAIVKEREANGSFKDLKDFCERLSGKEVNKRTVESFIKAGAFDSFPGTRKQLMSVYNDVMDGIARDRKKNLTGQLSLFDFMDIDSGFDGNTIDFPDIGEFSKEDLLNFEKEVLGIYVGGHPLDEYAKLIKPNVTATASMFIFDEEEGTELEPDQLVIVAGMITNKKILNTKTGALMCFLTIEDNTGEIEVIVFPRDYEKFKQDLDTDNKVFIKGRVSAEENKDAKLILQDEVLFEKMPKELWIKYKSIDSMRENELKLKQLVSRFAGRDNIIVYCEQEKKYKQLPDNMKIMLNDATENEFIRIYGKENISTKAASLKKMWKLTSLEKR